MVFRVLVPASYRPDDLSRKYTTMMIRTVAVAADFLLEGGQDGTIA